MIDPAVSWANPCCMMPIISRVLASGKSLVRRRPWMAAVILLLLLYGLGRGLYLLLAPEEAWLNQGWLALHHGKYAEAEQCFRRAQRKREQDALPRLALLAMLEHEEDGSPKPVGVFGQWEGLPWLGHSLKSADSYWAREREKQHKRTAPPLYRWCDEQFGDVGNGEGLFYDYWMVYPREVREAAAIMREVAQGLPERAWADFSRLRQHDPKVCDLLFNHAPRCYRYRLQAAWNTGHLQEVEENRPSTLLQHAG